MAITLFAPKVDPGVLLRAATAGSDRAVSHQLHGDMLCDGAAMARSYGSCACACDWLQSLGKERGTSGRRV